MLPVNCGSHVDYHNFVVTNLRKYYPNPNTLARSTWDIIERFWNLNLSFTDTFMTDNARTSAERSNKREKLDFKLEDGRHRSTKMWYCRLYHILMLQHLDAWDMPYESTLRKLILHAA